MNRSRPSRPSRRTAHRLLAATVLTAGLPFLGVVRVGNAAASSFDPPASVGQVVPALPDVADDAGDVVVVSAANRNSELVEGDANTVFSLRLPAGSVCPGDSANDDWRVQTFIVPAETDLGSLRYGSTRPRGEFMYGLYTTEGAPYVQVLLSQNPAPGLPGEIIDPPPLSFGVFTPDLLPVGRYKIGVACSYYEIGERYWDTEIVLTEDRDVQPGERRWTVASPADDASLATGGSDSSNTAVLVVVAIVVVTAIVAAFFRFGRRRPPALVKEHAR